MRRNTLVLFGLEAADKVCLDLAAADLAHLILSQLFKVVEGARDLVAGKAFAAVFLESLRVESGAIGQVEAGDDVLGAIFAWPAYHGDVINARVLAQDFFHLARIYVEAAGDDDLLDAANQADEAIFFHNAHVTGAEPLAVECGLGGLLVIEVPLENLWPTRQTSPSVPSGWVSSRLSGLAMRTSVSGKGMPT